MINRFLFPGDEYVMRDGTLWNAIFSGLNAVQSVVFLFFITRLSGEESAGIFTIAFSIAYLMIMIGNYGVRNYQATDVNEKFNFKEYLFHRILTCLAMLICSFVYVLIMDYNHEKRAVVMGFCILKMIESLEDVFHGLYQQKGRLDVASKIGAVRYIFTISAFVLSLIIYRNLIGAVLASIVISVIILVMLVGYTYPRIVMEKTTVRFHMCVKIFLICFPLFASGFFNMYISNASKYAIDRYLTDTIQGYYGMIFMPVFVIHLLSSFIYRPYLVHMAKWWREKEQNKLRGFIGKQMFIIAAICLVIIVGGYLLGIPILSVFYGTDLSDYRAELAILLLGGGMTAIIEFMNNIITVMRKQRSMLWIYGSVFVMTLVITNFAVKNNGITGAAVSYTATLTIQAFIMILYVLNSFNKEKKHF